MDSEEEKKLAHAAFAEQMAAETDNRLHAFWETYKGGIKGKLGGFVLGSAVGAALGIPAAIFLTPVLGGGAMAFAGVVAAFSGAGMLYGAHEFDQVGKISGGVAAGLQTTEGRLKKYLGTELSQIKEDIQEIKTQVGVPEKAKVSEAAEQPHYRKTHLLERHKGKIFYPKLALIGLAVGVAVGALLAASHFAGEILDATGLSSLVEKGAVHAIDQVSMSTYAVSMAAMGALGASFGINRDIFRGLFDKTDAWFKGISVPGKAPSQGVAQEKSQNVEASVITEAPPMEVSTAVLYSDKGPEKSGTYHRDQVAASRAAMLMGFDPGGTRPH